MIVVGLYFRERAFCCWRSVLDIIRHEDVVFILPLAELWLVVFAAISLNFVGFGFEPGL